MGAYLGIPWDELEPVSELSHETVVQFLHFSESWSEALDSSALRECYVRHCRDRSSLRKPGEWLYNRLNGSAPTCDDDFPTEAEILERFEFDLAQPPD